MTATDDIDDKNQADQPGYGFPVFVTHEGTTFRIQRRECERVGPAAVEATAARRGERPHTRPAVPHYNVSSLWIPSAASSLSLTDS